MKPPLICRLIKHKPKVFERREPTEWVEREGYWSTRTVTELDPVSMAVTPGTPRMVTRTVAYWEPACEVGVVTEFWMCKREGCTSGGVRSKEVTRAITHR